MNLNQFNYLLTIHKCGSITKAAQELFVSVPSISSAIRNLEDELGCTLLLRHRHGVTFTEQGEEAVRLLTEVEARLDALQQLAYFDESVLIGHIKLGSTPHYSHQLVLPMLVQVHERYPSLRITPIDGDSPTILSMVAQGALNIGIILYCSMDNAPFLREIRRNHLQSDLLMEDEMCFVVRNEHPLASRKSVTIGEMLQYPYYTYHKALNNATLELFLTYNPDLEILQFDDRDLLRHMLLFSDASSMMPRSSMIGMQEHYPGLTFLHISDLDYRCRVSWVHNAEPLTRSEKAVIDVLTEIGTSFCS